MDLDDKGRLRNVFWADARSRATCKEFGDVVTFDTTYLVNRYDVPFAPFVGVNHHDELEKQFQSAYTNAKAKEFQNEFVGKLGCSLQERKVGDVWSEYEVKEWVTFGEGEEKWKKRVSFTVDFNGETNEANCNCRLFEFRGMVCRHQLMVFHDRGVQRVPDKYVLRRWRKDVKRVHTKIRINYANSSTTIEARRHNNMCNLFNEVADLAEDCQEKYAKVMGRLRELKEELIESSIVCGSSMGLGIPNDSLSLGDGVVPSKESRNILDPEVEDIADGHVFGTQENVVNVNSYPSYMGHLMWPNMIPHNMQPNMAQGRIILPFSPTLCPTGTDFDQFFNNFPTSQSNMSSLLNTHVWRGQSNIMGTQVLGEGQSNFLESQGQGWGGAQQSFTEMMNARDNGEQ
ncbi:hypothetical protein RHMOL_Rhmol12G0141500 [Rhododendron molle]|uniref:Uncharacterized protein n=1 Tax=Rhododendron molle TaxID=49168 RepID=A0ACC0LHT9_RHOML|nr:hypothetical protein RHMOL_Rhmol12G0141500 [Rhododendron molle]